MAKEKCGKECEVYSRVVGFYSPTKNWNKGKKEEFKKRKTFSMKKAGGLNVDNDSNISNLYCSIC